MLALAGTMGVAVAGPLPGGVLGAEVTGRASTAFYPEDSISWSATLPEVCPSVRLYTLTYMVAEPTSL